MRQDEEQVDVSAENRLGKVSVRGPFTTVLLVVGIAGVLFALYKHNEDSAARQAQTMQIIAEAFKEVTYVLSLPQDKREKLNLGMPDSLRKRVREEHDNR